MIPEHQFRFWFFQHSNYHFIKNLASNVYGNFYLGLKFCYVVIVVFRLNTVLGDYISTRKTTFLFKFWPLTSFFRISKNSKSLRCGDQETIVFVFILRNPCLWHKRKGFLIILGTKNIFERLDWFSLAVSLILRYLRYLVCFNIQGVPHHGWCWRFKLRFPVVFRKSKKNESFIKNVYC